MTSTRDPGAGVAVTGLFLGSLALAGAVALVTAPITPRMAVARDGAGQPTAQMRPLVTKAAALQDEDPRFPSR